jgi:RNA 2',3'-cyclic 3'-phosphodiesterase
VRLFVALDFPEAVRASLRDLIARLRPLSSGARWARPEGMHITLKFIGETDRGKLEAISSALASVHSARTVEMQFRGLGFFPNERKPRVLWCALEASPNLATLAADIESVLEPTGTTRETRTFVPHLTLARFDSQHGLKGADKLVGAAEELRSYEFGAARESEFYLYESVLKPSGAEYKRLAAFPFVQDSE